MQKTVEELKQEKTKETIKKVSKITDDILEIIKSKKLTYGESQAVIQELYQRHQLLLTTKISHIIFK